jgi:hypothetical protein
LHTTIYLTYWSQLAGDDEPSVKTKG